MDTNKRNGKGDPDGENSNRPEELHGETEQRGTERNLATERLEWFFKFSESLQSATVLKNIEDEKLRDNLMKFTGLPESEQMSHIENAAMTFVGMMPYAELCNINLLVSVMGTCGAINELDGLTQYIDQKNTQTMNTSVEELYEKGEK